MVLALRIFVQLARVFGRLYLPPPGLSGREWRAVKRAAHRDLAQRTYQQGLRDLLVHASDPAKQRTLQAAYAAVYSEYASARFGPLAPYFPGQEGQIPVYGRETSVLPGEPSDSGPAHGDQHIQEPRP